MLRPSRAPAISWGDSAITISPPRGGPPSPLSFSLAVAELLAGQAGGQKFHHQRDGRSLVAAEGRTTPAAIFAGSVVALPSESRPVPGGTSLPSRAAIWISPIAIAVAMS